MREGAAHGQAQRLTVPAPGPAGEGSCGAFCALPGWSQGWRLPDYPTVQVGDSRTAGLPQSRSEGVGQFLLVGPVQFLVAFQEYGQRRPDECGVGDAFASRPA